MLICLSSESLKAALSEGLMDGGAQLMRLHHDPDGTFPNGIPNPLLPENRVATSNAVIKHKADMGIAWDGNFDRCFLFDKNGEFIEGLLCCRPIGSIIYGKIS